MGCRHAVIVIMLVAAAVLLPAFPVAADPFLFDAARVYDAGGSIRSEVLNDLDGDGRQDLAVLSYAGNSIEILLGSGDGVFTSTASYATPSQPSGLESGDLDNDGDIDLVVSLHNNDAVQVLHNDGNAGFNTVGWFNAGDEPRELAIADLDGDTDLDLAVTNSAAVSVLLNSGDGTFAIDATYPAADETPFALLAGDVNGDGPLDLLLGYHIYESPLDPQWGEVWTLPGVGDGTFAAGSYFTTSHGGVSDMGLADLDGDMIPDLVTLERLVDIYVVTGNLVRYTGLGGGAFGPADTIEYGEYEFLEMLDLNGDGRIDLVSGEERGGVEFFRGAPGGEFDDPLVSNFGISHEYAVFGEINGDGIHDTVASMGYGVGVLIGVGNGRFRGIEAKHGGSSFNALDLVDLDDDGDLDAVSTNDNFHIFSVFENLGGGIMSEGRDYEDANDGKQMASADFDGDGILDLAVVRDHTPCLVVIRGLGDLEYGPPELHDFVHPGRAIAASDLDGDGDVDLVLANSWHLLVLEGDGGGGFEFAESYDTGLPDVNVQIILADLSSDGHDELIVVSEDFPPFTGNLTILPGVGDGSFGAPTSHATPPGVVMAADADLDGDGHLDLAVASEGFGTPWEGVIAVFFGYGDGTVAEPEFVPAGETIRWVGVGDINDDGAMDLVSVHQNDQVLRIHINNGTGLFDTHEDYAAGAPAVIAALGDIDGDGDLDALTDGLYHNWEDGITILRNRAVENSAAGALVVSGPGPGPANPPMVRLFALHETAVPVAEWVAYGAIGYGVNVASIDLNGNGVPEILTGPGPGTIYGPHVRAFHLDGSPVAGFDFMAYGTLKYGVNVAGGDVRSNDYPYIHGDEIITGAGPGPVFGPHVRGWSWNGSGPVEPMSSCSFFAYGTPKWGVNVACGNVDGSYLDEIITGPGPGSVYGPHVRAFTAEGTPIPEVSFFAYGTLQYGVKVACGDIDGDGFDEIVTGPGPGPMFAPHVRGWNWDGSGSAEPLEAVNFLAHADGWWGVNVSCADLDGDGIDEILTGRGPDPALDGRIRGWNYDGDTISMIPGIDFLAWEEGTITHGATVAGVGW